MLSYKWVAAIVVAAFLIPPSVTAIKVVWKTAFSSALRHRVNEGRQNRTYGLLLLWGLWGLYVAWAATIDQPSNNRSVTSVVVSFVGVVVVTIGLWRRVWRIMESQRILSGKPCTVEAFVHLLVTHFWGPGASDGATITRKNGTTTSRLAAVEA